ncbi:MAG: hypothetical protein KBG83_00025 [Bacteroidetes bacterium]|nr:hypothetical protein [Bacteroidota bacterium]
MSNIIKASTKSEASRQMLTIDKALGDLVTEVQDIDDEMKMLRMKLKETKEAKRMKELTRERKKLIINRYEIIGQRKLMVKMLKQFGVSVPETKLTTMIEDESIRGLLKGK